MRTRLPRPPRMLPAILLAVAAVPVAAQDAEDVTFFRQFLVADDLLGMAIIWLLLAMSCISIAFAVSLFLRYRRTLMLPEQIREQVAELIRQKKYREAIDVAQNDPSFLGRVVSSALGEAGAGYEAMERAIQEAGDAETARILRPVEYLNVLGNIAPMLGLFGTVYGMIVAFQSLVAAGGKPDPADLAGGIATALVTTFWGLVVAIPALSAYAVIRNKIDAITTEGILIAEDMISPFKPGGKKERPGAPRERDRPVTERAGRPRATPKPEPEPEADPDASA